MVLTIGNDNNGLTDILLLRKTVRGHIDSGSNISTLCGNHRRGNARQEHLGTDIVTGNGQLHESISSKHDESDFVVRKVIHQVLNHHFRTVQSTGCHILCQHGITDIHTNNRLYSSTFLVTDLIAELGSRQYNDKKRKSTKQQPELDQWTETRHVGHQLTHQFKISKFAQLHFLTSEHQKMNQHKNGNQC